MAGLATLRRLALFGITVGNLATAPILATAAVREGYACTDIVNDNPSIRIIKYGSSDAYLRAAFEGKIQEVLGSSG